MNIFKMAVIKDGLEFLSADMKPVVCNWQRMVVGGSTFFIY